MPGKLTRVPRFKLNNREKEYLFKYHLEVYLRLSKYLNK